MCEIMWVMSLQDLHTPCAAASIEMGDGVSGRFEDVEEEFFDTAQAKTDDDEHSYLHDRPSRATGTIQAVAGLASRCHGLFR